MSSDTTQKTKRVVSEETMCCGFKRCPTVKVYDDGSIDIDDEGQHVEFNPEQATLLKALLGK